MDATLVKDIGIKALLVGGAVLVSFWTFNAVKLVISASGINPLVRKFFDQIAAGRIDAAYGLTTKTYKTHVKRQDFLKFLASLNLNKYRNLKILLFFINFVHSFYEIWAMYLIFF